MDSGIQEYTHEISNPVYIAEKVFCPVCSKVAYVAVPDKFECQDCNTRFIVNATDDIKITRRGELKIWTILVNLLVPVGFGVVIIFLTMSGVFFPSLRILSYFMIGHSILMAPREIWIKLKYNDPVLPELYFAFLTGRLNRYGWLLKLYFYSSLVVFCLGLIFLLVSFL